MNWLKVGAIVVGGIIVFFVVDSLVHLFLGLLTAIAFVAIVAGGAYVAYKIVGANRRRQVRRSSRARQVPREPQREQPRTVVPRATTQPAQPAQSAPHDVEDELARLRREMGQ